MRRLLALLAAVTLTTSASAATPNESGLMYQLGHGGTNVNQTWTPVYRACVTWKAQPPPAQSCGDNTYARINVRNVNADGSPKIQAVTDSWQNVPVPFGFYPSKGPDHQAVVQDYIGGRYLEFWSMSSTMPWTAQWGGGVPLSALTPSDGLMIWPTSPHHLGTAASGIAQVPGTIMRWDLDHATIDHPIHAAIKWGCPTYKAPATRTDGRYTANCVQEGAKFKLDPSVNVDAILTSRRWCFPSVNRTQAEATALGWTGTDCPLPPLARLILKSVQTRYIVITDQAGGGGSTEPGLTFDAESYDRPRSQNWSTVPAGNPYSGPWFGCDGVQGTGQSDARALMVGEWEQDCYPAQWSAWNGFPRTGWAEIP
jgi:hypothetical protein